jgi:outer membrane immunogenic protein
MKKILLMTVGLVALGMTPAVAADLAARPYTKAPAMVAAIYDWSGFYIGGNAGGAWAHDHRENTTLGVDLGSYDADGAVVGGQIGYRWQTGTWVFGVEAQGDWADLSGSTANLAAVNNLHSKLDAFGLFTGQVGYAWNNALLYVKGGAAVTDRRYEFVDAVSGATLASNGYDTQWSGTVGAGLEFGFAPNWSVGVEYDHIFEGRHSMTFTTPAGGALLSTYRSGGDIDLATVRLNYRFGGPIVAKY